MARPPRKPGYRPQRRTSAYRPRVAGRGRSSASAEPQSPETSVPAEVPVSQEAPETREAPVSQEVPETQEAPETPATETPIEPADGIAEPAEPAVGTLQPADGSADVEPTADTADGTAESAEPVEPTAHTADGTEASLTKPDADSEQPRPAARTRPVARVSTIKPNAGAASNPSNRPVMPGQPGYGLLPRGHASPSSFLRFRRSTLIVLGAVTAVLAIIAVVLGLHPGATIGSNKAFVDQAATSELVSQAQTKVCNANSATGVKFDEWSNKARAGLTGEALEQFNKQVAPLKQVMEQAKATTDCQIDAIGVRNLTGGGDGARAVILVNMVLSGTQNGVPTQSLTPRYQVNMEKHGDSWLIAKVDEV